MPSSSGATRQPVLEFADVTFDYGDGPVLSDVSLQVGSGEVVGLVGLSGAGKSTVVNLAAGRRAATSSGSTGTVRTLAVNLATVGAKERRTALARVGVIPQQPTMPGTLRVIHNVNAGRLGSWSLSQSVWSLLSPRGTEAARAALARVGISDLMQARTDSLSGGQLQRVAVARVLVSQPDLVLADEPTSAVDPSWSGEVLAALHECAASGSGVLVSLHDIELARATCHRIVGLRDGVVVADGPASSFTAADVKELYRLDRSPGR